ncbi:MAG: PAS domain S-box protein, partial [Gammaproteobacteria bacterium]|nr:PAS domain S-box protein [Gammaproteobacteria bacterium]
SHKQSELLASNVQAQLRSWFQPLQQATGYLGYFIIGPDNINLASSRDQNIGVENLLIKQKQFLRLVWGGETAISLPEKSDVPLPDSEGQLRESLPSMFVGSPILNEAGEVIAIFTLRINPEKDFTTLLQKGRIGDTGETYAFDREGRLISNSRFDDQLRDMGLISAEERGILNIELRDPGVNLLHVETSDVSRVQLPLTQMAASAITGKSASNLAGYRDYRGVTVVGAWLWDNRLGFGIAIELDKQEAYQTLRTTQNVILTLTSLIILLLIGMTIIFVIYHQRRQAEEALQKSEESFRILVEQSPIGIGISVKGQIRYVNPAYLRMFGYNKETNLAGASLLDNIVAECQEEISDRIARRFNGEDVPNRYETTGLKLDGSKFPFEVEVFLLELPDGQATVTFLTDLSERKQAEEALQRSEVLERLSTGAPLNEILTALVINAEKHNTEMLCSVLLLDAGGKHLLHGAAPSLPDYFNAAIDGIEIGPDVGCCGAAAYSGEQVITNDIMSHLNWVNFRKLAERANLRACCSEPIISSTGVILGTFAIYYRELRVPTQPALDFIQDSARLAGIAIERKQAEAALRNNEQQLRLITDNIPAFVAYVDSELHFRFNNKKYEYWFGMSQDELRGKHVRDVLGETSYQIQKERYAKVLSGIPVEFEYSIKFIDNKEHYISGSFIPDISDNGVTKGFFALVIDITER